MCAWRSYRALVKKTTREKVHASLNQACKAVRMRRLPGLWSTLMTETAADEQFAQLALKIEPQSKLIRAWALKGGISAQVTALEIERPDGETKKLVVRQHGTVDLKHNPRIASDEFKLLRILRSAGLATPAPYYLDQCGEILSTPCVVIEYIEGETDLAPCHVGDVSLQLATHLSRIHNVDCAALDLSFLSDQEAMYSRQLRERAENTVDSTDEGGIRAVLQSVWPLPLRNRPVLLHGDFWPGNILWKDGRLVGVIDWEDAALGDPLADVANSRLEILWAFGLDAMDDFTHHYASMTTLDWTNLPYWDLCAALRPASKLAEWATDDTVEQAMRDGHRLFVTQALEKLSVATRK